MRPWAGDGHQAEDALHIAAGAVDHAEEIRLVVLGMVVQPGIERGAVAERAIRQIVPQLGVGAGAFEGLPQTVGVARRVGVFPGG